VILMMRSSIARNTTWLSMGSDSTTKSRMSTWFGAVLLTTL
jgi:hypothetical protein